MKPKKNDKPSLLNLSDEAKAELKRVKDTTEKGYTRQVEDLIMGRGRFAPVVERLLKEQEALTGKSRWELLEEAYVRQYCRIAKKRPVHKRPPSVASLREEQEMKEEAARQGGALGEHGKKR